MVNYFPMMRASRRHSDPPVTDVALLDLTLDGNLKENPGPWTDFTLSAIHWGNVSDSLVRDCAVRGSVGDGIGVQGGHDNRAESCLVEDCRKHGLHPGTSLRGAVFSGNVSRRNGGDGVGNRAGRVAVKIADGNEPPWATQTTQSVYISPVGP